MTTTAKIGTEEWIRDHISTEAIELYLTSEYGQRLRLWSDGSWDTEGCNSFDASEWRHYEEGSQDPEVVCSMRLGNPVSARWFAEGWCHHPTDEFGEVENLWVETLTGRIVGDDDAMIAECLRDGDFSAQVDEIVAGLLCD